MGREATAIPFASPVGLLMSLTVAACGGSSVEAPQLLEIQLPGPPAYITVISGDVQSGEAGGARPIEIVLLVEDASRRPVPLVQLAMVTTATLGNLTQVSAIAATDSSGRASFGRPNFRTAAGPENLWIRLVTGEDSPQAVVRSTLVAAPFARLFTYCCFSSVYEAGDPVYMPTFIASDRFGNALPGIPVIFTVEAGGGNVTGPQQVSDLTGRATPTLWRLGTTPGVNTLVATSGSVRGVLTLTSIPRIGVRAPVRAVVPR